MGQMKVLQVADVTWDALVRSFANYDVYYLSGYVKAFQLHGDGEPLLFSYEDEGLRGIHVVMRRDIATDPHFAGQLAENTYFDFATPYGYGGWLIEGDGDRAPLYTAYQNWCCKHSIVSEFVRFHPVLKNHVSVQDFYEVIPLGATIAMDLSSPEIIWENLTGQNRGRIRKALKCGIKIYHAHCPEIYNVFKEIYDATMQRDSATDYYYFSQEFHNSIVDDLPENAQVFYAKIDEVIIAAYIVLMANGQMHYHLGGSLQKYLNFAPNNLLMYKIALWGSANGCKTLHLGGGVGSGEDSLFAFKKTFYRGEPCRYHIGKKIFMQEVYDALVLQRTDLPENGFFPRYRA